MAHIVADRILETSTTAGAGVVTLDGAVTGFRRFGDKMAVGDTCWYVMYAVDLVGRPTGEYEWGTATYSAANRLTRTTVVGSSNADAAVAFALGAKQVALTIVAPTTTGLKAQWRAMVGLDKVENLAPADYPVSTSQKAALDAKSDTATTVTKDTDTGAARMPAGTTAERGNPDEGTFRYNKSTKRPEFGNGSKWGSMAGAVGGGTDAIFFQNAKVVTADHTITSDQNATAVGPLKINPGVKLKVEAGARLVIG